MADGGARFQLSIQQGELIMECPIQSNGRMDDLVAYGARNLPVADEARLERHLADCAECRAVAEAQRSVWSALDAWEPRAISPDFDAKLYARIADDEKRPWWNRLFADGWSWKPAMPVAAACAALIAAVLIRGPVVDFSRDASKPAMSQQNAVDLEQVERALDDIDMLSQLGVVPPARM